MTRYSTEPRTYIKGYGIFAICKKFSNKYRKQVLDTGLDSLKTASNK